MCGNLRQALFEKELRPVRVLVQPNSDWVQYLY